MKEQLQLHGSRAENAVLGFRMLTEPQSKTKQNRQQQQSKNKQAKDMEITHLNKEAGYFSHWCLCCK